MGAFGGRQGFVKAASFDSRSTQKPVTDSGKCPRPAPLLEAASGIEPLYRVLQTPDEEDEDPS
jgi:hypothetical protein